ncbi:hypothetical protein DIC82_12660 [Clostridium beijerinckii]|nr:hypothetical protein DIC82_12660 [Clostridium beijerinckii]
MSLYKIVYNKTIYSIYFLFFIFLQEILWKYIFARPIKPMALEFSKILILLIIRGNKIEKFI